MKRFLFIVFIFVLQFYFFSSLSFAQSTGNLKISPQIIDEQAKAKDILKYKVKIKNQFDRKVIIFPCVNDITSSVGMVNFNASGTSGEDSSLAHWIRISRGQIALWPGEEKEIPLKIDVNLNAKPGEYHAIISFPISSNRFDAEKIVKEKNVKHILINLTVKEEIVERAQILQFKAIKNIFLKTPIDFNLEIKNSGNRDIKPNGFLYIYNRRGAEVATININSDKENIKIGENKIFHPEWKKAKGFGKFKVKLETNYGQKNNRDLQDTIFFWILPWKMLLLIGSSLFLAMTFLVILLFKKTYHRGPINLKQQQNEQNNGVLNLRDKK